MNHYWTTVSIKPPRAQPILRAGGPSAYYGIDDSLRFDMIRPDAPLNNLPARVALPCAGSMQNALFCIKHSLSRGSGKTYT
ncbi:nitrilotriacetate monooxygenase component B [Klebsiella pneumoniae]|uniref:Nitrilotriacetate monooxygenase component B n=1 Tax=Klebsiella pneumoniae TaxID=573 RepID=A0A377W6Q2_KLEPN|nr:nitrilotriacetate monooxygenase component B [Klebsiella pneumoniae]